MLLSRGVQHLKWRIELYGLYRFNSIQRILKHPLLFFFILFFVFELKLDKPHLSNKTKLINNFYYNYFNLIRGVVCTHHMLFALYYNMHKYNIYIYIYINICVLNFFLCMHINNKKWNKIFLLFIIILLFIFLSWNILLLSFSFSSKFII